MGLLFNYAEDNSNRRWLMTVITIKNSVAEHVTPQNFKWLLRYGERNLVLYGKG
jgi:hypothetical protein